MTAKTENNYPFPSVLNTLPPDQKEYCLTFWKQLTKPNNPQWLFGLLQIKLRLEYLLFSEGNSYFSSNPYDQQVYNLSKLKNNPKTALFYNQLKKALDDNQAFFNSYQNRIYKGEYMPKIPINKDEFLKKLIISASDLNPTINDFIPKKNTYPSKKNLLKI